MISNRTGLAHPALAALCSCLLFFSLLAVSGCTRKRTEEEPPSARAITVAAASNLTDALAEAGRLFTERTGVKVSFSFGGTADLAKQIENGAPFDLFASADVVSVERLAEKGFIVPETRRLFARGRLVLWTPANSPLIINRLEEMEQAKITLIAIAKPDIAPYGKAAVEALKNSNLWPQLESRVVYASNVAQAKQFAASGNADAAFIPLSLTKAGEGRRVEIESRLHAPLDQSMGVIAASSQKESARLFEEFILSDEGQAIMEKFGYRKPVAQE